MSDEPDGHASAAAKAGDAVDQVERNTKSQTTAASCTTTDHDVIREWISTRGGRPASVDSTGSDSDAGLLRIEYTDDSGSLEEVDWEPFFRTFDDRKLAFVYQEKTSDGSTSRFSKFVAQDS